MRHPSTLAFSVLLLPLALLIGGCSSQESPKTTAEAVREITASVDSARLVDMPILAPTPGTVVPAEAVQLSSRVMGYIRALKVVEGQAVRQGEVLFEIDPVDVQGAVAQAQQMVVQAEAALKDARADYERFEKLYKDEVINRQQFDKIKLHYEMAQSRVAQAKAGLAQARGQFEYTRVTAPITGVVTRKFAHEGDLAAPGHPILTLEDTTRLQVQTAVPESIFRQLKLGDAVQVEVEGIPQPLQAHISRLTPSADPLSRTYPVKLDLAGEGLKSGGFARVMFITGQRQVLAVPAKAMVDRAGIRGVFVLDAQDRAQFRMVRAGSPMDGMVEIVAGLAAGERVVIEADMTVQNGDRIVVGKRKD